MHYRTVVRWMVQKRLEPASEADLRWGVAWRGVHSLRALFGHSARARSALMHPRQTSETHIRMRFFAAETRAAAGSMSNVVFANLCQTDAVVRRERSRGSDGGSKRFTDLSARPIRAHPALPKHLWISTEPLPSHTAGRGLARRSRRWFAGAILGRRTTAPRSQPTKAAIILNEAKNLPCDAMGPASASEREPAAALSRSFARAEGEIVRLLRRRRRLVLSGDGASPRPDPE
jgi:hypothetical protein